MPSKIAAICSQIYLEDLTNTHESGTKLGHRLLEAYSLLRDSDAHTAEVLIFTDKTSGHFWQVQMFRDAGSFEYVVSHQPSPCSPQCRHPSSEFLRSSSLRVAYEEVAIHIANIATRISDVCRFCPQILDLDFVVLWSCGESNPGAKHPSSSDTTISAFPLFL